MTNSENLFEKKRSQASTNWYRIFCVFICLLFASAAIVLWIILDIWYEYYEFVIVGAVGFVLGLLISVWVAHATLCEFVITEKSVLAKTLFGKQLELSVEKITAISETKWKSAVGVFTPAGKIYVKHLQDSDTAYAILHSLMTDTKE